MERPLVKPGNNIIKRYFMVISPSQRISWKLVKTPNSILHTLISLTPPIQPTWTLILLLTRPLNTLSPIRKSFMMASKTNSFYYGGVTGDARLGRINYMDIGIFRFGRRILKGSLCFCRGSLSHLSRRILKVILYL